MDRNLNKHYVFAVSVLLICSVSGILPQPRVLATTESPKPGSSSTLEEGPEYNVSRSALGSGLLYVSDVVVESDNPDPLLNEKITLIQDDETISTDLPSGRSLFVIRLKDASIVNSFRFYNFEASGAVTAYVRATDSESDDVPWVPVSDTVTFDSVGPTVVWFNQEIEARLVRIVFDTANAGKISGFGVAGTFFRGVSPKQTRLVRSPQATDNQVLTNVLSFASGAQAVGTSGGVSPAPTAMIDDLVETTHIFSDTDPEPVALFDLGEPREIEVVSVLIDSPAPSRMELYFIDNPDEIYTPQPVATRSIHRDLMQGPRLASANFPWLGLMAQSQAVMTVIQVPPRFFENNRPNVIAEFEKGSRTARAGTGGSTFAQFVLVRWVYEDGVPPDFGGLVVNELNLLGRYTWIYEEEPEPPAERPENELAFAQSPVTVDPTPTPKPPIVVVPPVSP